jgi:hypothetical protein
MTIEMMYFLGGVLLSGLVGLVISVYYLGRKVSNIQGDIESLDEIVEAHKDVFEDNHNYNGRVMDELRNSIDRRFEEVSRDNNERFSFIERELDRRLDKLEHRLTSMYNDGCKPVKEQLNG